MHRSGSTTRASDEYHVVGAAGSPPSAGGKGSAAGGGQVRRSSSVGMLPDTQDLLLPRYDPQSGLMKKEAARSRSAESAVHLIPVIIVVCVFILWFFSTPQIDLVGKDDSVVARIENMTIDGYKDGATSLLVNGVPSLEQGNEEGVVHGRTLMEVE